MNGETARRTLALGGRLGLAAILVACLVAPAMPAFAIDLAQGKDFTLNLDTTLNWGMAYRVQDRDLSIISPFEGGTAWSVNGDDGNLNFDKGLFSNAVSATVELDFSYKNFGFFVRGFGFYDYEIEQGETARTPLTDEALERVGSRAELRDAFAWLKFRLGSMPGEIRVGQQVVSWGESTFIQNGINVINPVDVSALRVPGAELRDALLPVGLVWASITPSQAISFQAFYQYDWEEVIIDPPGTYFSTNDFVGRGGERVFLAFASFPDTGESPWFVQPPVDYPFMSVPRTTTQEASDDGQYGVNMRIFASGLGDTEFGLFFINYHSRLPVINGISGSVEGAMAAQAAGQAAAMAVYQYFGVPPGVSPEVDAAAARAGQAAGTSAFANTGRWYTAYPEDIKLYGLSWNTQLGTSGIAFQGECSYRQDAPYLVDDVELLFASLSPISAGLAATNQVVPGGVGFSTPIDGYRLHDSAQFQFTMTKVFGPMLGADQGVVVFEPALTYVFDMPDKSELRYEGPGTYTSGNPIHSAPGGAHAGKDYERAEHFADSTSWGYRLAGRLDYLNAIGAWNMSPRFGWQQDVNGVSPGPGGNFIEGLYALTLGVNFNYQARWEIDLSYNMFDGADRWNLINDRDFVASSVKFSF
jgi:hypothetical protein